MQPGLGNLISIPDFHVKGINILKCFNPIKCHRYFIKKKFVISGGIAESFGMSNNRFPNFIPYEPSFYALPCCLALLCDNMPSAGLTQ